MMTGYVKNMTHLWAHVMKRSVGPGAKIDLQDLYEQYGARHGLSEGEEFINWLKDVKLRDKDKWKIFTAEDKPYGGISKVEQAVEKKPVSKGDNTTPMLSKEMTVDDVVELSVRKAREALPKIHDIKLLKYAENAANQRAGKDSLRRLLLKRITELEVGNRR